MWYSGDATMVLAEIFIQALNSGRDCISPYFVVF